MSWVVDTCVILDIFCGDGAFAVESAEALDAKRGDGLSIAPVTYVESSTSSISSKAGMMMRNSATCRILRTISADIQQISTIEFGGSRIARMSWLSPLPSP